MSKRTEVGSRKQERNSSIALSTVMQQLVLPMMVGVEATRDGLLSFVHQMGLRALDELLGIEAESIAGPKGRKLPGRTHQPLGHRPNAPAIRRSQAQDRAASRSPHEGR
jgi:hypothetical protein